MKTIIDKLKQNNPDLVDLIDAIGDIDKLSVEEIIKTLEEKKLIELTLKADQHDNKS